MEQKFSIAAESFKSALEAAQAAGEPILGKVNKVNFVAKFEFLRLKVFRRNLLRHVFF